MRSVVTRKVAGSSPAAPELLIICMEDVSCSYCSKSAVSRSAAVLRAVLFPASSQVGLGAIGDNCMPCNECWRDFFLGH